MKSPALIHVPRWYQDLSIPQMENVFSLGDIIRADYDERVTGRTRRALGDIGVTSTFVKITPEQIKKSRRLTDLDPVKFLCEIYRIVTGNYFTDEEYKKVYDCNERIILSAIAFLTLPETVVELHHRIPMGKIPKLPPKPVPQKIEPRKHVESPYLESLFARTDWRAYEKELYLWRQQREKIPFRKAILPPLSQYPRIIEVTTSAESEQSDKRDEEKLESYQRESTDKDEDYSPRVSRVETKTHDVHENEANDRAHERVQSIPGGKAEAGQQPRPNFVSQENKIHDNIGAGNKRRGNQGESGQQSRPNVFFKEKKIHDKIGERNKRFVGKAKSGQKLRSNSVPQENRIHDKTGAGCKRPGSQGKSGQDLRRNFISQENKIHDKIGAGDKRPGSQGKSGQDLRRNFISQENKIHDKIGTGDKRPGSQGKSGHQSRRKFISRENKIHNKTRRRKKLPEEAEFERQSRFNVNSQQDNQIYDKIGEINDQRNEKSDYLSQQRSKSKSCLGEKDTYLVVSGMITNDDLQNYPISHAINGLAYVTPENSDENFFAAVNLDDKIPSRKAYPRGRENLSRKWQEWFLEMDEEFIKAEKLANEIIKKFEGTLKLMGPDPTCDGCCSCRQTKKINMKYHRTKTPQIVIDSITMDDKQNKYVVGSLAMNSPAPSPSESTADLPEVIASHDKINKNKIISSVTNEKGETNYYITGVTKDVEHVPRKIVSNSKLPKPIKNVPPCSCAIEKFINEGLTEVMSDDNIPWTKREEACIGKRYRPGEIGSSSCRDHPNDTMCRRNPFKKKIDEQIRAKLGEKENLGKDNYPPKERNMYSMADFQPCGDEDGMAICGGPWGAVNIPDEEELARREAEAKLIRESPPCGDKPGRAICGAPFGSRHPIPKKPKRDDDEDEEDEEPDEDELQERKKRDREARKKVPEPKIEKLLNRDDRCYTAADKNGRRPDSSVGPENTMQQYRMAKMARKDKKRKTPKENDTGLDDEFDRKSRSNIERDFSLSEKISGEKSGEKDKDWIRYEKEEITRKHEKKKLKDHWKRSKIMANKLLVSPVILPNDPPRECKRDVVRDCYENDERLFVTESTTKEGPFGWKTKSEEALPTEKTLVYLAKPNEPVEIIPVRPGGRSCKCRENRNAKKILLYNVAGTTKEGKGKKHEKISHVIDGLIYITPTPSVRNSEEYIPEYELYDSPYEKCSRERKNDDFKYIEQYLGPKSLMVKQPRGSIGCNCSSIKEEIVNSAKQESNDDGPLVIQEVALPAEKKWSRAYEDEGLVNFLARCRDNVPCWLRCVEFSKDGCCVSPRSLQVKRPVCECKYERKILKRDEEKKNWLNRQERLKSQKKELYSHVGGLSRPIETETNLIISDVKRTYKKGKSDKAFQYCVAGITQERVMRPAECILAGIGMHTPVTTPEPSKPALPTPKEHRHWSVTDVRGKSTISGNKKISQLRESTEGNWSEKIRNKSDKRVDVLFESGQVNTDYSKMRKLDSQMNKSWEGDTPRSRKKNYMNQGRGKVDINRDRVKDDMNQGRRKVDMNREKSKDSMNHSKQEDEEEKKQPSVSPVQQPHGFKAARSAGTEFRKKSSEKDLRQVSKNNVHTMKSTGNISQEDEVILHNTKEESSIKTNLEQLLQIELENMAGEGFLFAKLPECHLMPQLQYWIMYRKGIDFSPQAKKKLMDHSLKIWKSMEEQKPKKIEAPLLEIPEKIKKNMSWDKASEVKREVALKTELFYSNLRKSRVLQARTMWGVMEFGKFPGVSFKSSFFTYQASKESDGFVFKPWESKKKS